MPDTQFDEIAGRAIGDVIVQELAQHGTLFAVAIGYETAQEHPALYLAYETSEHCMGRLRKSLSNKAVLDFEARVGRQTGDDEHFALQDRLRDRIGEMFNTGNWINPADPVLLGRDPVIDDWANRAFQAILDAIRGPEDTITAQHTKAESHLRGTLWHAIDHARQTCPAGRWPPISFVQSFDDNSDELIMTIATRKPVR
jgi:hypothetical protein